MKINTELIIMSEILDRHNDYLYREVSLKIYLIYKNQQTIAYFFIIKVITLSICNENLLVVTHNKQGKCSTHISNISTVAETGPFKSFKIKNKFHNLP